MITRGIFLIILAFYLLILLIAVKMVFEWSGGILIIAASLALLAAGIRAESGQ